MVQTGGVTADGTGEPLLLQDEAFRMVRGIPRMMTYDNMTTVGRHLAADEVWLNLRFEAYRRNAALR